jgi:hypothetical protein
MAGILPQTAPAPVENSTANAGPGLNTTAIRGDQLPSPELADEFYALQTRYSIAFSKLKYNPVKNEITLYDYPTFNKYAALEIDGKKIGNYTIRLQHDTEFVTIQEEVKRQLFQLRKNSDYQIDGISMVTDPFGNPPGNYGELWVYQSTQENKKLDNTVILGWKILVYPMSPIQTNNGTTAKPISTT